MIETNAALEESEVFAVDVELYKKGTERRIASKYFIFSLLVGEYANIVLTNDNLTYDSNTSTYALTLDSGNHYQISYSISYNTAYALSFELADPEDAAFVTVDENGYITTRETGEDKRVEIKIHLTGANGILQAVFLDVTLKKSVTLQDGLRITNQANAQEVLDGDILSIYQNALTSFDVRYNGEVVTPTITIGNPAILELDDTSQGLKAIGIGTGTVTIAYGGEEITITINVKQDKVVTLSAEQEGSDFIIVNGTLEYLGNLYATYESGAKVELIDRSAITTAVSDYDDRYKTVVFTYVENGCEATVSYPVKYYVTATYEGLSTVYNSGDYYKHITNATYVLPNEGTIKLLVIPVWFSDSNDFFLENQKEQLLEDIEYTVNGNRPTTEHKSLKQYYEAQSYGAITMDITVSEFYHSNTSYEYYSDYEEDKMYNSFTLGTDAIQWYFDIHTEESLEDYDSNNDGQLDGLILYYGANYYGAEGDRNRSVAFEYSASIGSEYAFNTMVFCPLGGLYGLDRKEPTTQLTSQDLSETFRSAFRTSARIVIHEVGHMFGNEDLYEDQFAEERYSPAGTFVMQDRNYGSHDPYHVNRIGWSQPQVYASSKYDLGEKITIHLTDFQSSGQNIILTNTWNPYNSLYDEYLILELFAPVGLNEYDSKITYFNIPKSGIRLWHVNSLLQDLSGDETTSQIIDGHTYELLNSNNDVSSTYDLLHLIRNNPDEAYNTGSLSVVDGALFGAGDSFDMETFKSQFVHGAKLDNEEKLGWAFTVEEIYINDDGTYGAIITLERTDNTRTEFSQTVSLNRSDLETPDGKEEYGDDVFGEEGDFTLTYQYVTPPSVYEQGYPITQDGMCLFASPDGNGGYIELAIKDVDGKQVRIDSISVTYFYLTSAVPTVLVGGKTVEGVQFTPENEEARGFTYEVGDTSVIVQNQYDGTINHWSVLALLEITIHYTIE